MLFMKYLTVFTSLIVVGGTAEKEPYPPLVNDEDPPLVNDAAPYWVQTARPIPPELEAMFENEKKDEHTSYCLNDFRVCISAETQEPLCAIDAHGYKKSFPNICDMMLQNCRKIGEKWRYYNDDEDCRDLTLRIEKNNMKAIATILKNNKPIGFVHRASTPAPWAFFDA